MSKQEMHDVRFFFVWITLMYRLYSCPLRSRERCHGDYLEKVIE